jgi:aminoglycoside phosphotransferase (APT) family kinase protein
VPRLFFDGHDERTRRRYFATRRLKGITVFQAINQNTSRGLFSKPLSEIVDWLNSLQNEKILFNVLKKRVKKYTEIYRPEFNPINYTMNVVEKSKLNKNSNLFLNKLIRIIKSFKPKMKKSKPEIIHGSLSTYNILISPEIKGRKLVGVIDFEATRLANLMFDVDTLLLDLLLLYEFELARLWFKI